MKNKHFLVRILVGVAMLFPLAACGGNNQSTSTSTETSQTTGSLTLSQTSATLNAKETLELTATYTGAKDNLIYSWASSNQEVAKVKKDTTDGSKAVVTAVGEGNAKITLTLRNNSLATLGTVSADITVTDRKIVLNQNEIIISLDDAKTYQLTATGPVGETITWTSDNTNVATVNNTGLVTAKAEGTANIKAAIGTLSATCKVTVFGSYVSLNDVEIIKKGENKKLTVKGTPSSGATWASSNSDIVSVDNSGNVTAKKLGMADITLTSGSQIAKETIVVTDGNDTDPTELTSGNKATAAKNAGKWYYLLESKNATVEKTPTIQNGLIDINVTHVGKEDEPLADGSVSGANMVYLRYQPDSVGNVVYDVTYYMYAYGIGTLQLDGVDQIINKGLNVINKEFVSSKPSDASTAQIKFRSITKYLIIPVFVQKGAIKSLELNFTSKAIDEGATFNLTAQFDGGSVAPTYTSSDSEIATVDNTGLVTGVKAGTATITATYETYTATCVVTVNKKADPSANKQELKTGKKADVIADAGVWYYLLDSDKVVAKEVPYSDKQGIIYMNLTSIDTQGKKYAYLRYQPKEIDKTLNVNIEINVTTPSSNEIDVSGGTSSAKSLKLTEAKTTLTYEYKPNADSPFQFKIKTAGNYTFKVDFGDEPAPATKTDLNSGNKATSLANPGVWYFFKESSQAAFVGTPTIDSNGLIEANVEKVGTSGANFAYLRCQALDATKTYTVTLEVTVETLASNVMEIKGGTGAAETKTMLAAKETWTYNYPADTSTPFQIKFKSAGNYTFKITMTEVN